MALITEVEFDLSRMGGGDAPRHPGRHVSGVIRYLEVIVNPKIAEKRQADADMSPEDLQRMNTYREMGFMWEEVFEREFARRMFTARQRDGVIKQEPMEKDGIHMTPDGFSLSEWVLEEYKLTWRSAKRLADMEADFWAWFVQIKAYCYAYKTFKARLFVFFVNGNYAPQVPQARRFDMTFTPTELEANWKMILKGHSSMQAKGL